MSCNLKKYCPFIFVLSVALLVSCGNGSGTGPLQPEPDCDVVVSVGFSLNRPDGMQMALPDPGFDHGEWNADGWDALTVFFVYSGGYVEYRTISREEFLGLEEYADGCRLVPFTLLSGHISHIYAFASSNPQPDLSAVDARTLKNLKTPSLLDPQFFSSDEMRKDYLLNIFSGVDATGYDIEPSEGFARHIHIVVERLASKIDVQYDLADAFENGKITSPTLSFVTFNGLLSGWLFPEMADKEAAVLDYSAEIGSNISQRNGRMVFYTFPGVKNSFDFEVDYKDSPKQKYHAVFQTALDRASWHKVNFKVTGSKAGATGDIELKQ